MTGPHRNGPRLLAIFQCCTHRPGIKCARYQACPCKRDSRACTAGFPLADCCNKSLTHTPPPRGRPRASTVPIVNQNIAEVTKFTLIFARFPARSSFNQRSRNLHTSSSSIGQGGLLYRIVSALPSRPTYSPILPPPTPPQ